MKDDATNLGGRRPAPPTHRACPRPSTGPLSRPNWTGCAFGRRRTPAKGTPSPLPDGGCPWSRWTPASRWSGQAGRSPWSRRSRGAASSSPTTSCGTPAGPRPSSAKAVPSTPAHVAELSYLHSRDITYATFCQGPYDESVRYRDFMGWDMPWYSAQASLDALLVGRQVGLFHLVCYLRDGERVFETYWTTRRGVEAMDYSYTLMDLTVYGRQEPWEDSPPGWPQRCSNTRTDAGSPDWPPVSVWPGGRPIAQWPRLEAGRSDDLRSPAARS